MSEQIYEELLYLTVFLASLWIAGYLCRLVKISSIVGQLIAGVLLGPNGLDFAPLFTGEELVEELIEDATEGLISLDECPSFNTSITETTNVTVRRFLSEGEEGLEIENYLQILGQLGVTLLILESGLHVDFKTLKEVGPSAFFVAVIGTFMPVILGILFAYIVGFEEYPEGLAIGAVLAPTSVGIALKLLHEAHVLDSTFGQTIVTAAFTDDIFSLVTLAVLIELAAGDLNAGSVLIPLSSSFGFIAVAFLIAIYVVPRIVPPFLQGIDKRFGHSSRDVAHLSLMFAVLGVYAYIGSLIGSHLLGAFLSGITFSKVARTHVVWSREMDVINAWLIAIFFGATVAFAIPVKEILSLEAFWRGLVIGLVPGIIGKVASGFALKKRWVVGWAMVGRGEFAFLVAQTLKETEFQDTGEAFLSEEGFGVAVWALLIATMVAPIAFGFVLASQLKKETKGQGEIGNDVNKKLSVMQKNSVNRMRSIVFGDAKNVAPRSEWVVTVGTKYQKGLLIDLMGIFGDNDIHVKSYVNEGDIDLENTLMTIIIAVPDTSEESATLPEVRLKPSFRRMISAPGAIVPEVEPARYEDDFFNFDIEKYITRIQQSILNIIKYEEATVKIERAETAGGVRLQTQSLLPPDSQVLDDGDDKDSI